MEPKTRRIIQQKDSFTVTLPKKWVQENNLQNKDHIIFEEIKGSTNLMISSNNSIEKKSVVNLTINDETESAIRTMITNAYRTGYDILEIKYINKKFLKIIKSIVENNLLGFEIVEESERKCIVENIAEPNAENYNNIFLRILHIISTMFKEDEDVVKLSKNIQKYDNFCRRAMSKRKFNEEKNLLYWHLFTTITHATRYVVFLERDNNSNMSKQVKSYYNEAKEYYELLKKTYLKKDIDGLDELQKLEKELVHKKGNDLIRTCKKEESILVHHIMDIIRNFYLATSPMYGLFLS